MSIEEQSCALDALIENIFMLGENFLHQGKVDKALIIFEGLMALLPHDAKCHLAYGEALVMAGQVEEALDHFLALSKLFQIDSRLALLTAKACMLLGRPAEAKELLSMITSGEVVAHDNDYRCAQSMIKINEN